MTLNNAENELLRYYTETLNRDGIPSWAFQFPPPIPFVGDRFSEKKPRVLVYGSAENLVYTTRDKNSDIFSIGEACNYRHKYFYLRHINDTFFPFIHIQPINDGSLLTAARFCLYKMNNDFLFSEEPKEFISEIAVANFGKYSINVKSNKDYASDKDKIEESLKYVIYDLMCLRPDIIILPSSIYKTVEKVKGWKAVKALSKLDKEITIIKIFQTNVRVINTHISRSLNGTPFSYKDIDFLKYWVTNSISNMEKYVSWLDQKFSSLATKV